MPLSRTRGIVEIVSDRRRLLPEGSREDQIRMLVAHAAAAAAARADFFQVRERDLGSRELLKVVRGALAEVAGSPTRILVNDRLDVALACGAHGIQLPGSGIRPADVRAIAPPEFVVVQSIHADERPDLAADMAVFGTVYPSASKAPGHRTAGLAALAAVASAASVPVLAIGGITENNVDDVARVCGGVAAVGWFATTDPRRLAECVRRVRLAFDTIPPVI